MGEPLYVNDENSWLARLLSGTCGIELFHLRKTEDRGYSHDEILLDVKEILESQSCVRARSWICPLAHAVFYPAIYTGQKSLLNSRTFIHG